MTQTLQSLAVDPKDLTLVPATPEQARLVRTNTIDWFAKWDKTSAEEWEQQDEDVVVDTESGLDKKRMTVWLLVPRSTLLPTSPVTSSATIDDIYVHYETYRLPALHSTSTSKGSVQNAFVHTIGTVWTPPKHRRQGYARLALQLGHYVLAKSESLPPFPKQWGQPPPVTLGDAVASVLSSDVGTKYYTSCTIGDRDPGWVEQGSVLTEWDVRLNEDREPVEEQWTWVARLSELRALEDLAVKDAIRQHQESSRQTRVTPLPTGDILTGHHNRLLLRAPFPSGQEPPRPTSLAAYNSETASLLVFYPAITAVSYPPFENKGKTLCLTQVIGDVPWKVVQEAARREGCVRIEIWGQFDAPADWPKGLVLDRGDLYSMMAYYGPLAANEEKPEWVGNGMWIPCRTWNFKKALASRDYAKDWI